MIDWPKLQMLVGPRFRQTKAGRDDREKLARAHMRRAKGQKKHSTNKERSHLDRKRAALAKATATENLREVNTYKMKVRAYWRGELEEFPKK